MYTRPIRSDELYHYGVKGMRWGVRRYQNYDGTWKNGTGKKRHSTQQAKSESDTLPSRSTNMGENKTSKKPPIKTSTTVSKKTGSTERRTQEQVNTNNLITSEEKEKYGISEKGWLNKEGQAKIKQEREAIEAEYSKNYNSANSKEERDKALAEFNKRRNEFGKSTINQHYMNQEALTKSYRETARMAKDINKNLQAGRHEVAVAVNKYGDVKIIAKDPQFRDAKSKGYEVCKNMNDVMNNVNVSDIRRTKSVVRM